MREADWKLVAQSGKPWELYNLAADPTEMRDVSGQRSGSRQRNGSGVEHMGCPLPRDGPAAPANCKPGFGGFLRGRPGEGKRNGVLVAQGGEVQGYALYIKNGVPVWAVRVDKKLTEISAPLAPKAALPWKGDWKKTE